MQQIDRAGETTPVGAASAANPRTTHEPSDTGTKAAIATAASAQAGFAAEAAPTGGAEAWQGGQTRYFRLADLFSEDANWSRTEILRGRGFARSLLQAGAEVLLDRFDETGAQSASLSFPAATGHQLGLGVTGGYQLQTAAAGGWLLMPAEEGGDSYWIPQPPMLRRFDKDGHILSHRKADIAGFDVSASSLEITLEVPAGHVLDLVVWRFPADEADFLQSLQQLGALERQRYFLWSSHTAYERPADLYLHLVHGLVYENHEVWPKYWRVCSELDAHALYLVLSGLERATGKRLYKLLKRQVVFSVIARQSEDGGWYHGEWTDGMESHYRLHTGGVLMLANYLEASGDPVVRQALERAVAFSASRTDKLKWGSWFLHDSLEQSLDTARLYPFRWIPSRAFGKSETNMLILNTHLDTAVSLERYRRVTGDQRYGSLVESANQTTRGILGERPADWLYKPLFRAIGLTYLPAAQGQALPLPARAMKRIAWKYLAPLLPAIKKRFPRLVMPDGFIDRSLSQVGLSYRYQPVNLMDLIRTRRIFDDASLDKVLEASFAFTQHSGIKARWKEMKGKEDDSLGFWAEALYHLCLANPALKHRAWLAEAMLDLEDNGLGLSPSLLGANAEAMSPEEQHPCPSPRDSRLRVANLSHGKHSELLVVNPTTQAIALEWEISPQNTISWQSPNRYENQATAVSPEIPPRSWLRGLSAN
jgi:hypothetical protein